MAQNKTIFVTGATGNQGGEVARSLLRNGFAVKALTRDPSSPKVNKLRGLHAEIVQGDLNEPSAFRDHLKNVDAIFCVLKSEKKPDLEIKQGIELANLAKIYNVSHFLYSSVNGADLHSGIPHWESKWVIENHIRQINLPHTIIRPASLYENFLIPQVKKGILKGKLVSPLPGDFIQLFVGSPDIGEISTRIFQRPDKYLGKIFPLIKDRLTMEKVAAIFSDVLGKEIKYQKMPLFLTRIFMGKNLYKMFSWINSNHALLIEHAKTEDNDLPNGPELREWIKLHFILS